VRRLTEEPLSLREAAPELSLPAGLESVLRRALSRRREERHSSAREFAEEVSQATTSADPRSAAVASDEGGGEKEAFLRGAGTEDVPRTEISPTGGAKTGSWSPSRLAALGGGTGLLLLALFGILLLTRTPANDEPPDIDRATVALDDPADRPEEDPEGAPPPGGEEPELRPPPVEPLQDDDRVRPQAEPESELQQPGAGVSVPALPDEPPVEILRRQLLARDPAGADTRYVLQAMRDTTMALWSEASMSRADSALAAYVIGSILIPLGDSIRGVEWLEEAVRLDPRSGYVELLRLHRGG